jgi:trimethylamine--corrinoid protein Co-methyltransferase
VFGDRDLARIRDAAVRVFGSVTAMIDGPEAFMQALSDFGCDVSGTEVQFPRAVVDEVMARIGALKQERDAAPLEPPPNRMSYSASGQGLVWHDPRTDELRPATREDQAFFSHICDSLELSRGHPTVICTDVPPAVRDIWTFGTALLNSRVPCLVSVYSKEAVAYFHRILDAALGREGALEQGARCVAAKVWINSPFRISRECIDYALEYRDVFGQPLSFIAMPVMGASTPGTVAGCTVQSLAESLMANALSLALDGRVVGSAANPLALDMRYAIHVESGPDVFQVRTACTDAAEFVFGGRVPPLCVPSTMAKKPGAQSVFEKSMGTFWAVMAGARSCGGLGRLAAGDIGSPVQLILDLELMRACDFLLRDVSADDDHLAEDVILQTVPSGARFMEHEHTARFFREESWIHTLLDRRLPNAWIKDPKTMVDKAREEATRLMEEAPNCCPLSEPQRKDVEGIMEEATRHLAE